MPDPKLPLPGEEELVVGKTYLVEDVQKFHSEVQGFEGYRLTLSAGPNDVLAIPLWTREIAGRKSKLGSFMMALGEKVGSWNGRCVIIKTWEPRNRVVEEVECQKGK